SSAWTRAPRSRHGPKAKGSSAAWRSGGRTTAGRPPSPATASLSVRPHRQFLGCYRLTRLAGWHRLPSLPSAPGVRLHDARGRSLSPDAGTSRQAGRSSRDDRLTPSRPGYRPPVCSNTAQPARKSTRLAPRSTCCATRSAWPPTMAAQAMRATLRLSDGDDGEADAAPGGTCVGAPGRTADAIRTTFGGGAGGAVAYRGDVNHRRLPTTADGGINSDIYRR